MEDRKAGGGFELEPMLCGCLFSLGNLMQREGDRHLSQITTKQQLLLTGLCMFEEPPTLTQMAEMIGCSYQNVKKMAAQLEDEGVIEIRRDNADRRRQLLVMTDRTREVIAQEAANTRGYLEELFYGIPREDAEATLRTVVRMHENIGGKMPRVPIAMG